MGYFPVRYHSRVVIYDRRGFIRLATGPGMTHYIKLLRSSEPQTFSAANTKEQFNDDDD